MLLLSCFLLLLIIPTLISIFLLYFHYISLLPTTYIFLYFIFFFFSDLPTSSPFISPLPSKHTLSKKSQNLVVAICKLIFVYISQTSNFLPILMFNICHCLIIATIVIFTHVSTPMSKSSSLVSPSDSSNCDVTCNDHGCHYFKH